MAPPLSDHCNGRTFFYPGGHPERGFLDVLKWRLTSRAARWPATVALTVQPPAPAPREGEMVATWLGHATYLVQTTAGNILFDPVFSERASPVRFAGPKRAHPVPLAVDALPEIAAVCLSHDHYDHCDVASLRRLAQDPRVVFIAPLQHRDLLAAAGAAQIVELDWWQSHRLASGVAVTLTPAKHWTKRLGTPRNHRLWGGFWIEVPGGAGASANPLWFVGDTGFDEELVRAVRNRLGVPQAALVPIGAYEPRWFMAPMHMNPAEAVQLHRLCGARLSLAMHWGTFQLTDEGYDEPVRALAAARLAAGISAEEFAALAPGESRVISPGHG